MPLLITYRRAIRKYKNAGEMMEKIKGDYYGVTYNAKYRR